MCEALTRDLAARGKKQYRNIKTVNRNVFDLVEIYSTSYRRCAIASDGAQASTTSGIVAVESSPSIAVALSSFGILAYMQGYSEEEDHATSTRSPRSITGAKRVASHLSLESRVTKLWPFR